MHLLNGTYCGNFTLLDQLYCVVVLPRIRCQRFTKNRHNNGKRSKTRQLPGVWLD